LIPIEECRAFELEKTHGCFALLLSINEIWSSQVVLMWRLVREGIGLSAITVDINESSADRLVETSAAPLLEAVAEYCGEYDRWRMMHVETVDRHDPFFRKYRIGVEDWVGAHGADAATWLITDPTKDELYLEVAAGVAQLRGTPYPVQLPEFRYWRRAPWTPTQLRPVALGLPPFISAIDRAPGVSSDRTLSSRQPDRRRTAADPGPQLGTDPSSLGCGFRCLHPAEPRGILTALDA